MAISKQTMKNRNVRNKLLGEFHEQRDYLLKEWKSDRWKAQYFEKVTANQKYDVLKDEIMAMFDVYPKVL